MNKLFILLILIIIIISGLYFRELFTDHSWRKCNRYEKNFLNNNLQSSTINDLKYNRIKLACKDCPKGMIKKWYYSKSLHKNPNSFYCDRIVTHLDSGEVNTNDEDCGIDCYKSRCKNYNLKPQSLGETPDKDTRKIFKCNINTNDYIGSYISNIKR